MPLCVIFYISDFLEATVELDPEAPPDDAPTSRPRSSSLGSSSSSSRGGRGYSHPRRRHRRDLSTSTSSSTLPERHRRGGGPPSKPSQACRARTPQVSSRAWPCSALRRGRAAPYGHWPHGPPWLHLLLQEVHLPHLLLQEAHLLLQEAHLLLLLFLFSFATNFVLNSISGKKNQKLFKKNLNLFLLNFSCHFVFLLPLLFLLLGLSSLPCMAR